MFDIQKEGKLESGSECMQTKKEELRQMILDMARIEFLHHGYENSSLRVIAKKAHTTLGNIYHYFPNKEAILDEILAPAICGLNELCRTHFEQAVFIKDIEEFNGILESVDLEDTSMRTLLSPEFVILMKTDVERYVKYREHFKELLVRHIAWHMGIEVNHFVRLVMDMMIECLIHLNTSTSDIKEKRKDFMMFFKTLCAGIVVQKDEKDK